MKLKEVSIFLLVVIINRDQPRKTSKDESISDSNTGIGWQQTKDFLVSFSESFSFFELICSNPLNPQ
jgi:hypothetical protein